VTASTGIDLGAAVAAEFLALANVLDGLPNASWDTSSLCEGWRVREVVAHLTMPVRYSPEAFRAELRDCGGDFTRLSNRVASRDAALPTNVLVGGLRDETMHRWVPPGGGPVGALNHVVIHALDVTVPLGLSCQSSEETIRSVLDDLTQGGTHAHFGVALTGLSLRATDMHWSFGSGAPITGAAADLALLLCGRTLPGSTARFREAAVNALPPSADNPSV
jgi:uncharacterized protein (TIGR03083 family)